MSYGKTHCEKHDILRHILTSFPENLIGISSYSHKYVSLKGLVVPDNSLYDVSAKSGAAKYDKSFV